MGFVDRYVKHRSERDPEFKQLWEQRQTYIRSKVEGFIKQGCTEEEAFKKAYDELEREDNE